MFVFYTLRLLVTFLVLFIGGTAHAELKPVAITHATDIASHFDYLEDTSAQLDINHIVNAPEAQWQTAITGQANFGMTASTYWLRFSVENQTEIALHLIASLDYSQLDDVQFYVYEQQKQIDYFATGDTRNFYPRRVDHPTMLIRFNLVPDQVKTVFIRIQTQGSMILPLRIWHENNFFEEAAKEQKLHFFYFGCITVIILINLAVFLTLREKLYLYYALAITGYLLFFSSILGFSFQHFYPQLPVIHGRALLVSMPILAFFSVLFCREFLKTKEQNPKLDIALRAMMYFEIFNFISSLFFSYNHAIMLSAVSAFFFFSVLFVAGPISWATGMRAGIFFTMAWTPLTIGVLSTTGRSLGFLPDNFVTQYSMQIGSGLEAFILTLALADRLYREREDKIEAQADNLSKEKARHEADNKLAEAMIHDPVTKLPNRNRFEWMVKQRIQQNPDTRYLVGVARVTRLGEINRTLGLSRSEQLLKRVAEQMAELASQLPGIQSVHNELGLEERVYQLSGDTFGVLVDPYKETGNIKELEDALKLLTAPVMIDNLAIELHPKFGAAYYPKHGNNAALLIRNAHVGMEITPHGKQELGFYSPDYDIYSESRLTLMSDLREALSNNQTELYYQPKACMKSDTIIGLEALIRWHHPDRGWVFPNDFIPLAEETGVITQLTQWAFEQGIKDLAELNIEHPTLGLSINISARDLTYGELLDKIEPLLEKYQVKPERLTIELTETAAMEDPEKGLIILKKIADLGIGVSIDDFGSGYSSLSYLKQLPASEIKLDRSLIMDVCTSESSKVIVQTSINMAHGLGYQLIAEGVEDKETVDLLKSMGCDRFQGFWLCRPIPMIKLKPWLAENKTILQS